MALRDFVKSFADFSWSLPVFALSQATKLVNGLPTSAPTQKATESFEASTDTITKQFDSIETTIYNVGKTAQDAVINLTFNFFSPTTFNPQTILQTSTNVLKWGVGVATQFIPGGKIGVGGPPIGWGPVNIDDAEPFRR